jgi:hypothetical protein
VHIAKYSLGDLRKTAIPSSWRAFVLRHKVREHSFSLFKEEETVYLKTKVCSVNQSVRLCKMRYKAIRYRLD